MFFNKNNLEFVAQSRLCRVRLHLGWCWASPMPPVLLSEPASAHGLCCGVVLAGPARPGPAASSDTELPLKVPELSLPRILEESGGFQNNSRSHGNNLLGPLRGDPVSPIPLGKPGWGLPSPQAPLPHRPCLPGCSLQSPPPFTPPPPGGTSDPDSWASLGDPHMLMASVHTCPCGFSEAKT